MFVYHRLFSRSRTKITCCRGRQPACTAALAGAGLAIVPEFLVAPDIANGTMEMVLPNWELPSISLFAEWQANAPKHGLIHLALNALSRGNEVAPV